MQAASKIKIFITIALLIFIISLTNTSCNVLPRLSYNTTTLPTYQINLDLPIKQRYKNLLTEYKYKVQAYSKVTSYFSPLAWVVGKVGKYFFDKNRLDPDWYEYIEAVSEYCEIPISEAIMLSVTYEMACTSIVLQDKNNNILIGRNLDFETYFVIAHLMFQAEYYKNNEHIFTGVELLGFRGIINAMKPGKFSVSMNLRTGTSRFENLYRIYKGYPTPNHFLMKVVEQANSYEVAKLLLSTFSLSSPVYYIISGVQSNEGAIITRSSQGLYSISNLNVEKERWFLVICNTDLDHEESQDDFRRIPTEENLERIGRERITYENIFSGVLSLYPTNNLITVYSTVQSAKDEGYFNTTLWLP
jgi:acid ceramidase